MPDLVPTRLLQPALDAALQVVRAGAAANPPVAVPPSLRPWLTSPRLRSRSAYQAVRAAVEADPELRARVADAVSEDRVGRVAWLWLSRPEGWEAEVASAATHPEPAVDIAGLRQELRRLERRLEAAEAARDRAFAERDEALATAAARVADAREARQRADEATGALAAVEQARDAARCEAERASAAAAEVAEGLRSQLVAATGRVAALDAEVAALTGALDAERRHGAAAVAHLDAARRAAAGDRERVAAAVADAAGAAVALGNALARVGAEVAGAPPTTRSPLPAPAPAAAAPPVPQPAPPPRRPGLRRTPLAVPPGIFDDTTEWAELLVRTTGALLLVDGYNVTLASWPGRDLADQRRTLVDALAELHAKTGAEVVVVFDGHPSQVMAPPVGRPRDAVRVRFSPAGEDADEVVIEAAELADARRPVVVATDDRRVRGEVASRGANVVSVAQLIGLLRRSPEDRHTPRR